jgi:hypothetical protein
MANTTKSGNVVLSKAEEIQRLREYLIAHEIKFETSGYFDKGTYFAVWGMTEDEFERLGEFVEKEL